MMGQSKPLQSILIVTVLYIPQSSFALDIHPVKLTLDIFKKVTRNHQANYWGKVTGIPVFVPQRHSDGCSGGMSAVYNKLEFLHTKYGHSLPWQPCCVAHDHVYYYGGSRGDKNRADEVLKECVSKTVGNENFGLILGRMMKEAVWIGGIPYFPTSYRWGYGEDFRDAGN